MLWTQKSESSIHIFQIFAFATKEQYMVDNQKPSLEQQMQRMFFSSHASAFFAAA